MSNSLIPSTKDLLSFVRPQDLSSTQQDLARAKTGSAPNVSKFSSELASAFGFSDQATSQNNYPSLGAFFGVSTFCGWGSQIGVRQNFDSVTIRLFPFDAADMPRFLRCKVRETSASGTILADVLIPLPTLELNRENPITVEFGTVIANVGGSQVWLEYQCDGKTAVVLSASSAPVLLYTTDQSMTVSPLVSDSATPYQILAVTSRLETRNVWANGTQDLAYAAGTFTAWGNVLSSLPPAFNVIQIPIYAFDANHFPRQVRIRFRQNTYQGTVIATSIADVLYTEVGYQLVTFVFDSTVPLAGTVYAEIVSDGRIAFTISSVLSTLTERYSTIVSVNGETGLAATPTGFQLWFRSLLRSTSTPQPQFSIATLKRLSGNTTPSSTPFEPTLALTLPTSIYAVEGLETNIYFDGIFNSFMRPELFEVRVNCVRGRHDDRRWRIVPSASGYAPTASGSDITNTAMTIEALFNGQIIDSATTTLKVKAAATGAGQSRKAIFVGDSVIAGGGITQQVLDLVTANPTSYALTLLGTQGTGANKHEGHSGKTYNWLRTNALSPFVFSGSFNFSQYLTANSYTMSAGDSVFLNMGINDLFGQTSDANAESVVTAMASDLAAIIANIQAAVSGIKVWVGLVTPPSHDQSAFGNDYPGASQYRSRYNRNIGIWRSFLIATYGGSATVGLAPVNCCLDTINNMAVTSQAVNARNATTTSVQTNGVHPANSGELQIGDCFYACLMSTE
jgi:lysophospholipase L1-like esterase